MKKKTVITAGILGVLAVAAGVWFYHPAGKVDQEILSRLEGCITLTLMKGDKVVEVLKKRSNFYLFVYFRNR